MTEINLLPWRELKREQEKNQFIRWIVATIIMAIIVIFLIDFFVSAQIEHQMALNARLEKEIAEYKKQLMDIKNLKTLRQGLIARMNIVQNLQATRILTVRLFDELIHILPDGVYITRMDRVGDKITVSGYTESNSNISQMMRNIQSSQWIQLPQLTEIKKLKDSQVETPNEFKLSFILQPKKGNR